MTPDELKAIRLQLHLSQRQMAAYLGVTERAYQQWEYGKAMSKPGFILAKVMAFLGPQGVNRIWRTIGERPAR